MKETVIITGVAGFIGSHVAMHGIDMGFNVVGIDNLSGGFKENIPDGVNFLEGDVCDDQFIYSVFRAHSPKFCFHWSAYAAEVLSPHIKNFNYLNKVMGSMNIINACVNTDVRGRVSLHL